jgi:hypothetical protein
MPLESALHELTRELAALSQCMAELCAIAKDRPEPVAMTDAYEETMDEIQMSLAEAYAQVGPLTTPAGAQGDKAEIWQALLICQACINHVEAHLCNLQSVDRVAPLLRFGSRQGGEWPMWARLMKEGVARCLPLLQQVRQAQLVCWQEMAEHSAGGGVVVRNTAIGQQITWHAGQSPLNSLGR